MHAAAFRLGAVIIILVLLFGQAIFRETLFSFRITRHPRSHLSNSQQDASATSDPKASSAIGQAVPSAPKKPVPFLKYKFKPITVKAPQCYGMFPMDVQFTLVTQFSIDRIWLMGQHCERWGNHPISVAVFDESTKATKSNVVEQLDHLGCNTTNIAVAVVGESIPTKDYPINRLRNLALAGVATSHVLVVDFDFVLSPGIYEKLLKHRNALSIDPQSALVLPAFGLIPACDDDEDSNTAECQQKYLSMLPKTKKDLKDSLFPKRSFFRFGSSKPASVVPFPGHKSTRYNDWFHHQGQDELLPIGCFSKQRYEPFLAVRYCKDLPPFQEAFTGYGPSMETWIAHLRRLGYQFYQPGDSYLVHIPHSKSLSQEQDKARLEDASSVSPVEESEISLAFSNWMDKKVRDNTVVPVCESDDFLTYIFP